MKSHLILTPTNDMSEDQWHYFRFTNGLGASDIGCVLGLTASWKSPIELFYQKLDPALCIMVENINMFFGTEQEDWICDKHQYWDGTVAGMIANFRSGKIIRKNQRVNAFVQNPKYPYIFVSLDRKINKGEDGEEGALEAKWVGEYVSNKYIGGIPPAHLAQVQTQLMICEFSFGELAVVSGGNKYDVYPFSPDPEIFETIAEKAKEFWESVLAARIIVTQIHEATISHNMRLKNKLEVELAALEPALVGGEAEDMFLKEKFKRTIDTVGIIKGTDEEFQKARELKGVKEKIKGLEAEASVYENELKRRIGAGIALDFGKNGKVSWTGTPKRFSNAIKFN